MELSSPGDRLRQLIENYVNSWLVNLRVEELQESIEAVTPDNRYSILSSPFDEGKTILHQAVSRDDCQIISCVLDNESADERFELLKIQDAYGDTPLHKSPWRDGGSIFKVMVDRIPTEGRRVLFKITNTCNRNAFHKLARDDDMVVDYLRDFTLDEKIDLLKTQDEEGKTPLHAAAEWNNPLPFKHMLESLPTESRVGLLMMQDEDGRTPLCSWAINMGGDDLDLHEKSVGKMISDLRGWMSEDKLLDLFLIPDNEGKTFTHLVCSNFGIEFYWLPQYFTKGQIFTLLTVEDKQGRQPLYYALERLADDWDSSMETTSSILRLLPSSEKVKQLQSHVDVVSGILRNECDIEWNPVNILIDCLTSEELRRILSIDAYRESIDVDLLTLNNISRVMNSLTTDQRYELVSNQDEEGNTSLHLVTTDKAVQILQSLSPTQRDQLLDITNNEGKTAIDVKEEEGNPAIDVKEEEGNPEVGVLRQYRSSVSIQQTPGGSSHKPTDMTGSVELDSVCGNPSVDAIQMSARLNPSSTSSSQTLPPPTVVPHDQKGKIHAGSKRSAPCDWSGHPSTTSDLNVLSGHIENQTVQFTFHGKGYIASFKPSDRVSDLINQVEKVTRGKCSIKNQAGNEFCDFVTLDLVKPPFVMCVDNSKAIISESAEPSTSTSTANCHIQGIYK